MGTLNEITMTKAEALRIQKKQVEHYAGIYGPHVRDLVKAATTADKLENGVSYPVSVINQHIPRGHWIENLIPEKVAQEAAAKARLEEAKPE